MYRHWKLPTIQKHWNNPNARLQQPLDISSRLFYCRQDPFSTALCSLDHQWRCTHMKLQFLKKPFCSSEGHVRTNQSTVHCYCLAALGYGSLLRSKEGCSPLLCNVLVSLGYHHANGMHKCSYHKLNLNTQTNKKFNIAIPTHPMRAFCILPKSVIKILWVC